MSQPIPASDQVRRFIIENRPVRGHWVRLESAWQQLRAHQDYPAPVRELLGEAAAASVLLAATLKFHGTLALQLQGNGAVRLLVAQCTHDFRLRAVAHFDEAVVESLSGASSSEVFRKLAGSEGRLAVTIEAEEQSARYQGIVPLTGQSLADSLEAYFSASEQLPTRILLAADGKRAGGMLLQRLPADQAADEEQLTEIWREAQRGIETLRSPELLECSIEELLRRGFSAHDMRLFRGSPVSFQCRCSPGRVAGLLRALGEDEVRDVLREQGSVTVVCEFCHRPYRYDAADVVALFAQGPEPQGSHAIH